MTPDDQAKDPSGATGPPTAPPETGGTTFLHTQEALEERLEAPLRALAETPPETEPEVVRRRRAELAEAYWDGVIKAVRNLVRNTTDERLEFSPRETEFLGYALPARDLLPAWVPLREQVRRALASAPAGVLPVIHVHDTLQQAHSRFLRFDKERRLLERDAQFAGKLDAVLKRLEAERRVRDHAQQALLSEKDQKELRAVNQRHEKLMVEFLPLQREIHTHGLKTEEERRRYLNLRRQVTQYLRERERVLDTYAEGEAIREGSLEIERSFKQYFDLLEARIDVAKQVRGMADFRRETKLIDVRNAVRDEAYILNEFSKLASRRLKLDPVPVPLGDREVVTPERALRELDRVLEWDPRLFENEGVRLDGLPSLLLVPGLGNGNYDVERNRLIVPEQAPRDLLTSVVQAAIYYRLDVDRHRGGRAMIGSFHREVKGNEDLTSQQKLRVRLMKAYFLWVTKESQGFQVLGRELRAWFERRIGPNKNDVITPYRLRGLDGMKAREEVKRLELLEGGTARVQYELAVLHARLDHTEKALEQLRSVMRAAPGHFEAYYSAAILFWKMAKQKEARTLFTKFVRDSPPSWWSRKAQEHLLKLSS
ncbi:MAG: hypothetical protein HY722_08365 [Planctomycetes bacterium]|nr:hypothetical protein [Planctomycetota bacterium]